MVHRHIHRCKNHLDDEARAHLQTHSELMSSNASISDTGQQLVLNIHYVIMYTNAASNIGVDKVVANHGVINANYLSFQNTTTQETVSAAPEYSTFTPGFMGNPDIQFLPNLNTLSITPETYFTQNNIVETVNASSSAQAQSGYSNAQDAQADYLSLTKRSALVPGVVYVFICNLAAADGGGQILGIAEGIIGNYLAIHYGTVGSAANPSGVAGFDTVAQGMTLCHELGHCFGLLHPFPGEAICNDPETLAQYTINGVAYPQANPNFYTSITSPLVSNNFGDNRGRDYLRHNGQAGTGNNPGSSNSTTPYSCPGVAEGHLDTSSFSFYEPFFNIMDYGGDAEMLGFFENSVVNYMRPVILNHSTPNTSSFLFDISGNVIPIPASGSKTSNTASTTSTSSGFPTWAIVVISVVGGIILIVFLYFMFRKKPSAHETYSHHEEHTKPLTAYHEPQRSRFV